MVRFNTATTKTERTTNHAGGEALLLTPEYELYSLVCNSLVSDKFYEKSEEAMKRLIDLVDVCDPDYTAALVNYARTKMNLRTISVVLATILAKKKGGAAARRAVGYAIRRPDEIVEMLAFYGTTNPAPTHKVRGAHKIKKAIAKRPNSMIRGIRDVFESGRFGEYGYAKYDKPGQFSIRDALFLTHPKPRNEEQAALFQKIAQKELKTPDTWEVALSAAGSIEENKAKVWERLLNENKLGHMALLRNLRNILQLKPSADFVTFACKRLVEGVAGGKQLPFRYWSALKQLFAEATLNPFDVKTVATALELCIYESMKNIPQLNGRKVIACDVSGSMHTPISQKSTIPMVEVGAVLAMGFYATDPAHTVVGMFGDRWQLVNPTGRVLFDVEALRKRDGEVGYATNGYKVLEGLNQNRIAADHVLMFTDAQMYGGSIQSEWATYRRANPNARLYIFDLAGHGQAPLRIDHGSGTFLIAGWSERIFEACQAVSEGTSIVDMIRGYAEESEKKGEDDDHP